tara:strand:+ start:280 stop:390 length:111 start_codon:yes stop_codon:yes gene_type:complete
MKNLIIISLMLIFAVGCCPEEAPAKELTDEELMENF